MEAERRIEKQERQISDKSTPKNIMDWKSKVAAEARENNPSLMALYNAFLPGSGPSKGRPKYVTDVYGNRVRSGMEIKGK